MLDLKALVTLGEAEDWHTVRYLLRRATLEEVAEATVILGLCAKTASMVTSEKFAEKTQRLDNRP